MSYVRIEEFRKKQSELRKGTNRDEANPMYGKKRLDVGLRNKRLKTGVSNVATVGKLNIHWKEVGVSKSALHVWVRRHKVKPELCVHCNIKKPYDLANISGEYKRDINDFLWLCRGCHMKYDFERGVRKMTEEQRLKLSKAKRGKKMPPCSEVTRLKRSIIAQKRERNTQGKFVKVVM